MDACCCCCAVVCRRSFTGNRPSTSLLLPELSAYTVGQVLALYEHQVAVQVGPLRCAGSSGGCGSCSSRWHLGGTQAQAAAVAVAAAPVAVLVWYSYCTSCRAL
jgi:hypothetical protein